MMRILVLIAILGRFAIACSGGSDADIADLEASGVQESTVAAMDELSSYRVEISVDDSAVFRVDFEKPNQYRTVSAMNVDDEPDTAELRYLNESIFMRECTDLDEGCGDWTEQPRGDVVAGVGSPSFFPQWPIVALEMAGDLTLDADGDDLVVRGTANLIRAVLENERRIFESAGVAVFGQECTSIAELSVDGTPQQHVEPAPTEVCRDTTFEDLLEQEADDIAAADANPATIEARIDPETYLIREFVAVNPTQGEDNPTYTFRFVYSDFNEITIEAPEEFR